ncbi:hypothetical protein [Kribbella voronezhensis]|uniref:hypothetical protein n=1 Tax=Kribbella voronezhensis TaxID=2512212 RepID=UPI00141702C5|nr:hypothetical protein [Kribbella voronezhensis]
MRIDVLAFDGFAEVDALATYAVFANARRRGLPVEAALVTADGATEVTGCYGTKYADLVPWDPSSARVLAVSGGWIREEIDRGVIPRQPASSPAARRPPTGRTTSGWPSGPKSSTPASSTTAT